MRRLHHESVSGSYRTHLLLQPPAPQFGVHATAAPQSGTALGIHCVHLPRVRPLMPRNRTCFLQLQQNNKTLRDPELIQGTSAYDNAPVSGFLGLVLDIP